MIDVELWLPVILFRFWIGQMNRTTLALSVVMLLAACASTGVVPMDRDSFMISKTSPACGFRTAAGTRAEIYAEANQFCAARRQQVSTISSTGQDGIIGAGCASAELVFRCVDPAIMDAGSEKRLRDDLQRDQLINSQDFQNAPRPMIVTTPPPRRYSTHRH
jgi:hypothetical protein